MIARFRVLLPFVIAIPKNEILQAHEFHRGPYHVRVRAPYRAVLDPADAEMRSPVPVLEIIERLSPDQNPQCNAMVLLNNAPTFDANVLQIEFTKEAFDRPRKVGPPEEDRDPPPNLGFEIANEFLQTLRTVTRGSKISVLGADTTFWELAYLTDEGVPLDEHPVFVRRIVGAAERWQAVGLNNRLWTDLNGIRQKSTTPPWDRLLLDADSALPDVASSISLANAALEAFSTWLLDQLPSLRVLPPGMWEWINDRGDFYKEPSVDDRFGELLGILAGQSMKSQRQLWQAYKDLRNARNSFAHTGRVTVGKNEPELNRFQAAELVKSAALIVDWCETLLPEESRRPSKAQHFCMEIRRNFKQRPFSAVSPELDEK